MERQQPGRIIPEQSFCTDLDTNVGLIRRLFGETSDLVVRHFRFGGEGEVRLALVFIDGLVDRMSVSESILKPLVMRTLGEGHQESMPGPINAYNLILDWLITFASIKETNRVEQLLNLVLAGFAALFVDGFDQVIALEVKGWKDRAVNEAKSEAFVRGPRDGFTETLRTNTALVRRRIRTPNLRFEMMQVGAITKTDVVIAYIQGVVNPEMLDEVKKRISSIDTDGILESGYLEDFIKDDKRTVFALLDRTERPDKVAAALLEGRVAIMIDNTPFALIVPAFFSEFLQSPEDYYEGNEYTRLFRWVALFITITLPSFYVALTTYHQEMIPSGLALSMAAGREGVPFPALVEALLMEVTFDLLREAGSRMPRSVGQALGVVGALVLGQAAVAAGIVSPLMVIIVALTAITSFIIPNYSSSITIRMIRYPMLLLAGAFGLAGIFWGLLMLNLHLNSLRSFGVPYLYPVTPAVTSEWGDVFFRAPWWKMDRRPRLLRSPDKWRQAPHQAKEEPPDRQAGAGFTDRSDVLGNPRKIGNDRNDRG